MQVLAISGDRWIRFTANYVPGYSLIWALSADVTCLAALLYNCLFWLKTKQRFVGAIAKGVVGAFAAIALYTPLGLISQSLLGHRLRFTIFSVGEVFLLIVGLGFFFVRYEASLRVVRTAFLISSPLLPLFIINSAWRTYAVRAHWQGNGHADGMLPAQKSHERVIWIVFDELDRRMLFEARPSRIALPEFDRLRAESLDGVKVESPAMNTPVALPSLMLQANVRCFDVSRAGDLLVKIGSSAELISYKAQPDIFEKARSAGFNAGVAGWLFPYCRMLGSRLSDCGWGLCGFETAFVYRSISRRSFLQQALYLARWQVTALPSMRQPIVPKPEQEAFARASSIETLQVVLQNAFRMLQNPNLNLVFIHLPVPHPPGIWDVRSSSFTMSQSTYVDNLQLADKILGQFRQMLERSGDWERSTILVSSDHPFRPAAWTGPHSPYTNKEMEVVSRQQWFSHIPFLLNLPFQHEHITYRGEFNSVLSSELVLKILNRQLQKPEEVTAWLDQNRARLSRGVDSENNSQVCE